MYLVELRRNLAWRGEKIATCLHDDQLSSFEEIATVDGNIETCGANQQNGTKRRCSRTVLKPFSSVWNEGNFCLVFLMAFLVYRTLNLHDYQCQVILYILIDVWNEQFEVECLRRNFPRYFFTIQHFFVFLHCNFIFTI